MQEPLIGRHSLLRGLNYRAVFERLAANGPSARSDLARELELSGASVTRLIDGLLGAGLVLEGARVASRAGRRRTLLDVNPRAAVIAGLSIRARTVRLLLTDLKGTLLARHTAPRNNESPAALVRQVRDLVFEMRRQHAGANVPLGAVVVGISGAWDGVGRRVHAAPNLALLEGVDLLELLEEELAGEVLGGAITVDNDINYAALGELAYGAARGVSDFFYLSLGAGVGGAAVVGGELHRGTLGFAGEVGYLPVVSEGQLYPLETLVSRGALERYVEEEGLAGEAIFEHPDHDDEALDAVSDRVGDYLGQALAAIVTILDPSLIVLGGGLGRYSDHWITAIRARLIGIVPEVPELVSTELGWDASLRGALAHGLTLTREALIEALISEPAPGSVMLSTATPRS